MRQAATFHADRFLPPCEVVDATRKGSMKRADREQDGFAMTQHSTENRRAAGLEPIGTIADDVVRGLRQRMARRTKAVIVSAGQRRLLPRWLATLIVSRTGLRGA